MKDLSSQHYSHDEIRKVLHMADGSRTVKFRYDLLDKNEHKISEITNVISGEVSMSAFNTIKRTARFRMKEYSYERANFMTWAEFGAMEWSDLIG